MVKDSNLHGKYMEKINYMKKAILYIIIMIGITILLYGYMNGNTVL